MNFLSDPKIMVGLMVLIFSVIIYFYINYQVGIALNIELVKMKKHKALKIAKHAQMLKRQQYTQSRMGSSDQDSYYDPADNAGMRDDREEDENRGDMHQSGGQRLTKDNILMRDMMGL
jgi:hypothetical protein